VTSENITDSATPAPPRSPKSGKRRVRHLVAWGAAGAIALVVLVGSLVYTEQSSFCPTCHEMDPYYQAWTTGGHAKSAGCVDCHVDSGVIAHLAHKPTALKEVWNHFFTDNRFPNYGAVEIPNSRCIRCHPTVPNKIGKLFSHDKHKNKATCKECHAQSGHVVSLASLAAAGVLKADVTTRTVAGMTPSVAPGHKKVVCQGCHNQATMKCSSCHQPPHENRGECSDCHQPGGSFVISHSADSNCAVCHDAPAKHYGPDCHSCHQPSVPFAKTKFTHVARLGDHNYRSFPCVKCHPKTYSASYCTCHKGGVAPRD
jgi:hypothetical protein